MQNKERWKPACKPGSVVNSHSSGQRVATRLKQPTRELMRTTSMFPYLVLLRVGFTLPLLLPAARCALTAPFQPYLCLGSKTEAIGGIFSAALSVGSRPPGVTWHSALWSPDFPPHPPSRRKTKKRCRDCSADFRRQAYASKAMLTSQRFYSPELSRHGYGKQLVHSTT